MPVGGKQVLPSIVVEVSNEVAPSAEGQACHPGACRVAKVVEQSRTIAEEQKAFVGESRDKKIGASIIVEIAGVNAHRGNRRTKLIEGHATSDANLFELPVA